MYRLNANSFEKEMGNHMTRAVVHGVQFLRNICSNGMQECNADSSPRDSPLLLPPSHCALNRKGVGKKALRRPSKGVKKNGNGSFDCDDFGIITPPKVCENKEEFWQSRLRMKVYRELISEIALEMVAENKFRMRSTHF